MGSGADGFSFPPSVALESLMLVGQWHTSVLYHPFSSPPPLHGVIPNPVIVWFEVQQQCEFVLTFLVCSIDNALVQ